MTSTHRPTSSPRRRARVAGVAVAAVLALAMTACGIPTDDQPRAISPPSVTTTTVDPTSSLDPDSASGVVQTVYLIEGSTTGSPDGERLAERTVEVPSTTDEAALVRSTLKALIALSSDRGQTNAVPSGTEILDVDLSDDGSVVTIDLSDEFNDVEQSLQRSAFAQLVFSATGVNPANIERVRFRVEGDWIAPATGNDQSPAAGDTVTRNDYPSFATAMASSTTEVGGG